MGINVNLSIYIYTYLYIYIYTYISGGWTAFDSGLPFDSGTSGTYMAHMFMNRCHIMMAGCYSIYCKMYSFGVFSPQILKILKILKNLGSYQLS